MEINNFNDIRPLMYIFKNVYKIAFDVSNVNIYWI